MISLAKKLGRLLKADQFTFVFELLLLNFGMDDRVIGEKFRVSYRHDYNLRAWLPVKHPNTANHRFRS